MRVSDDPRIGFLKADVARFCDGRAELAPAIRLRRVVQLREALGEVTDAALDEGMAAAKGTPRSAQPTLSGSVRAILRSAPR